MATESASTPAEIEHEIEQTRQELAETVDELAAKFDVKAQAQQRVAAVRESAQAHPGAVAAAGTGAAVLTGVAALMAVRRKRRR